MADYWIKLYHEILDDPLMATMPDHLWRRTIELFLTCGRQDKDGMLPDAKQISWMLRTDVDSIQKDLAEIAELGIITKTENGWLVNNFAKRQAPSTSTERSQAFRDRKRKDQYYGNEDATQMQQNVAQNRTDTDQNITEQKQPPPAAKPSILDPDQDLLTKALKITSEKLELTDGRRKVLKDIRTNVHAGADKFMDAVRNMMASPSWPNKSLCYFIDKPFDAINRVDQFANAPPKGGNDQTRTVMDAPPELMAIFKGKKNAVAT